jgi:hypothetical protein
MQEFAMILAHRIHFLTDQMWSNTLRASGVAIGDMTWLVAADWDWLAPLLRRLSDDTDEPRAA